MLSVDQIRTYNTDGLVKSSIQLSSDKIKDLNSALDKYLEDHKGEIMNLSVVCMREMVNFWNLQCIQKLYKRLSN